VSQDSQGTYVIQKFVAFASTAVEELFILDCVRSNIMQLTTDSNGTYVIQAIVKKFKDEHIQFIMSDVLTIESNLMGAACNCHGICVVKALIDKIGAHQTQYA
jgi:hypothetical protein